MPPAFPIVHAVQAVLALGFLSGLGACHAAGNGEVQPDRRARNGFGCPPGGFTSFVDRRTNPGEAGRRRFRAEVGAENGRHRGLEGREIRKDAAQGEYDVIELFTRALGQRRHGGYMIIDLTEAAPEGGRRGASLDAFDQGFDGGDGVVISRASFEAASQPDMANAQFLWPILWYEDLTAGAEGTALLVEVRKRFNRRNDAPRVRVMLLPDGSDSELWVEGGNPDARPIPDNDNVKRLSEPEQWFEITFAEAGEDGYKVDEIRGPFTRNHNRRFHRFAMRAWDRYKERNGVDD